ncbi:tail fiber domain-containing protein [Rhodobacteraceae bacterium 63075]|nr:tail fiber domain-containing protein [Rhodobacteraceae bacterium 63075]
MSDPVLEQDIIVEETASSSSGAAFVGLLALVLAIPVLDGGSNGLISVSDERLKTDIARVGATASGLPLYTFRYKGDSALYQGVMAQDVLQAKPEAVITGARGFMAVDYSRIDAEMIRVE